MKRYLNDSYFNDSEIKGPKALQKLKELLHNLDEVDNPVIVIGNRKEIYKS